MAIREAELVAYQDAAYARRYRALADRAAAAERSRARGMTGLAEAVARNYFKLLAYKDEYEVARLYAEESFLADLNARFEGDFTLRFHLAPPIVSRRDPRTGEPRKREFGPWMLPVFRVLARFKRFRGGAFDVFGRTRERRMERRLITEYEDVIGELIDGLAADNHALATEIASLPSRIRGFGHVKERNVEAAKAEERHLLSLFRSPAPRAQAAE